MSNENKQLTPVQGFEKALDTTYKDQIAACLQGSMIPFEKFKQIAVVAYSNNPGLQGSGQSLISAIEKCARDGLLPDGKEAALVPFGGKITYMPMVDGVIKKIHETGLVKSVIVEIVRENDEFEQWADSEGSHFKWAPPRKDRGEFDGVFAVIYMNNGGNYMIYMDASEVAQHEACSKNKNLWKTWKAKMWKKTAVHQVAKLLPKGIFKGSFGDTMNEETESYEQPDDIQDRAADQENVVNGSCEIIDGEIEIPEGTF